MKGIQHERHYKGASPARSELLPDNTILKMRLEVKGGLFFHYKFTAVEIKTQWALFYTTIGLYLHSI